MRRALVGFGIVAAVLLVWWGRGEMQARSTRPRPVAHEAKEDPQVPETAAGDAPAPEAPSTHPDPVERGDCTLRIRMIDAQTGLPASSIVDLWRLDAPGNEEWTAGDQLQATTEVLAEGATLEALPAGVYRPFCLAERYAADDPAPFRVEGATTEVAIRVERPRLLHAYVKVVDPRGVPLPSGSIRGGSSRRWTERVRTPAWRKPRTRRGDEPGSPLGGGGGGTRSFSTPPIPQPAEGFELGPFPEDSKDAEVRHFFTIEIPGCGDVLVVVPGTSADGSVFVGLAVPLASVPGDLRLPDGRTIAEAKGKLSATFGAVLLDASAPVPLLSDRPFWIHVDVPGFKPLSFEHRLGDPVPSLTFEPAEPETK